MVNLTLLMSALSLIKYDLLVAQVSEGLMPSMHSHQWSVVHVWCVQNLIGGSLFKSLLTGMAASNIPVRMCPNLVACQGDRAVEMSIYKTCTRNNCIDVVEIQFNVTSSITFNVNATSITAIPSNVEPRPATVFVTNSILSFVKRSPSDELFISGPLKAVLNDLKTALSIPLEVLIRESIPMLTETQKKSYFEAVQFGRVQVATRVTSTM